MIGALAYHVIKTYLFDIRVVCVSLIIGGFILIDVDRLNPKPRYQETAGFTLPIYFIIGIARQCFSMIPGVSRAGAKQHRERHAARRRSPLGDGIFLLAGDANHGPRLRL